MLTTLVIILGFTALTLYVYRLLSAAGILREMHEQRWNFFSLGYLYEIMVPYSVIPLISFMVLVFLIATSLYVGQKRTEYRIFAFVCSFSAVLSCEMTLSPFSLNRVQALEFSRISASLLVFSPTLLLEMVYCLIRVKLPAYYRLTWLISLIMLPMVWTPLFYRTNIRHDYGWFADMGPVFVFFSAFFLLSLIACYRLLKKTHRKLPHGWQRMRIRYVNYGVIGGGLLYFGQMLPILGVDIYPLGSLAFIPFLVMAYGLFYHNVKEAFFVFHVLVFATLFGISLFFTSRLSELLLLYHSPFGTLIPTVFSFFFLSGIFLSLRQLFEISFGRPRIRFQHQLDQFMQSLTTVKSNEVLFQQLSDFLFKRLKCRFEALYVHLDDGNYRGWTCSRRDLHHNGQSQKSRLQEDRFEIPPSCNPLFEKAKNCIQPSDLQDFLLLRGIELGQEHALHTAELIVPVLYEHQIDALLLIGPRLDARDYTYAERQVLFTLGSMLGSYLENTRLVETLEAKVKSRTRDLELSKQEVEHLNQFMVTINSTLDITVVLQEMLSGLKSIVPLNQIVIGVVDENQEYLDFLYFSGDGLRCQSLQESESIDIKNNPDSHYVQIVKSGQPRFFTPITKETLASFSPADKRLYRLSPALSVMLFPLTVQKRVIGVIHLGNNVHAFALNESQHQRIQRFITQVSTALYNSMLYNQSQKDRRLVKHLNQVAQTVNSTLDLDEVIKAVTLAMQDLFDFNQLSITMLNEQEQLLLLYKTYGSGLTPQQTEQLKFMRIPLTREWNLFVHTVLFNECTYLHDLTPEMLLNSDPTDVQLHEIVRSRSYLFCPLSIRSKAIGTITFGNTESHFTLTERDIAEIMQYVNQIAGAINNAWLFEELKRAKVQLAESEKVAKMTEIFEKFVPRQFLDKVATEGLENIKLGSGESSFTTILFSDIRSFTSFSEGLKPQELLNFLNAYFQRMNEPIRVHGGVVDKFVGDAILALFDANHSDPSISAEEAVMAAMEMRKALSLYNQHRANCGYQPIAAGIGIHSGQAVIGTVGTHDRMDSTVLGDTVNAAARLEGLTKQYGVNLIVSYETFRLLNIWDRLEYRILDLVRVFGKKRTHAHLRFF